MMERPILTAQNCQHPDATTQVAPRGNGWREHRATCQHCRFTFSMWIKADSGKEVAPPSMAGLEILYEAQYGKLNSDVQKVLQELLPGEENPSIKIYGASSFREIEEEKP